jgi:hypothetical protein
MPVVTGPSAVVRATGPSPYGKPATAVTRAGIPPRQVANSMSTVATPGCHTDLANRRSQPDRTPLQTGTDIDEALAVVAFC